MDIATLSTAAAPIGVSASTTGDGLGLLQLVLLAIIQGITEWLPISSSAHLIAFPKLTGLPDQGPLIDAMAHLGSLFAVLVYFWRDVARLAQGPYDLVVGRPLDGERHRWTGEAKLFTAIALATLPGLALGFVLQATGALDTLRSPTIIAAATIGFGVLLWVGDTFGKRTKTEANLTIKDMVIIGLAQALAFIPGASRSGVAMTAARALGFSRAESARFGMLVGVPLIAAVGGYALLQLALGDSPNATAIVDGQPVEIPVTLADGLIVAVLSFLAAWASVAALMALIKRMSFLPFVLYRFALGGFLFIIAG